MKIQVDFYKPSGKWYAGGEVEVGDVKLWHGKDVLLRAIWKNQTLLHKGTDQDQWTVVSNDIPYLFARDDYRDFFNAVLHVGVDR